MSEFADQTIFEDGKGNCLAACVASVLGVPINEVPNFAERDFFAGVERYIEALGLAAIQVRFRDPMHFENSYFGYGGGLAIMWGDSPRFAENGNRKQHAVVGQADGYGMKLIHDPHPSRDGLHGSPIGVMWIIPAKVGQATS